MSVKTNWRNNIPDSSIKELEFISLRPDVFGKDALNRIRKIVFQSFLPDMEGACLDISKNRDGSIKACLTSDGRTVYIGAAGGINASDCKAMFYGLEKLEEIVFEESAFHTDLATDFAIMFCDCTGLTSLDLSSFDTSNVIDFDEVFEDCIQLKTVDLTGWDTSQGKQFRMMFSGCESLTELDLTCFNTGKAVTFEEMFYNCKALKTLDIRYFDTITGGRYSKYFDEKGDSVYFRIPANIDGMFSGCKNLENLYTGQRFEKPKNAKDVFRDCRKLNNPLKPWKRHKKVSVWQDNIPCASIIGLKFLEEKAGIFGKMSKDDIRKVIFISRLPDMKGTTLDISESKDGSVKACLLPDRKTIYIGAEGGINAAHCCKELFHWMGDIEEIIFEENAFHTDLATDFSYMFNCCSNLKALDLSGFNTSESTNFQCMFNNCESLERLNISSFKTARARDFSDMFSGCNVLEELDVSGFETSGAKNLMAMFFDCGELKELDVSGFDTSSVTNFTNLFTGCSSLKELDLHSFDTSNGNQFMAMFESCESLKELDLSSFDTSNASWFDGMFKRCKSLETVIASDAFVIQPDSSTKDMFFGCDKLDKTKLPAQLRAAISEE